MNPNRPPALTDSQKQTIRERLTDTPKNIAKELNATYEQVRMYHRNQIMKQGDIFDFCPITGFKIKY